MKRASKDVFDFKGYATRHNVKCSDGRVIKSDAFKHAEGEIVPLVWQHLHDDPTNILGHAVLEHRADGVYAYGLFNNTEAAKAAKELVSHGDIKALSIHANKLIQKGTDVVHGVIREVSLVVAGANPGAFIDDIGMSHDSSGEFESIISFVTDANLSLSHSADENDDETLGDIVETMNEKQKSALYALVAQAIGEDEDEEVEHSDNGGDEMKKNVFEGAETEKSRTLTHAQFGAILETAKKNGSFKQAVLEHATTYGIEDINVLFPDAQTLRKDPDWLKREDDWVAGVLAAVNRSPFSRIKSMTADMNIDTARARGYVKATLKKEVYFKMAKRITTPTTVYVKQKLDRDDIIDVVDFDVVDMVRFQLRTLLNEELAQAILIGDLRDPADPDKINEDNIRPIWKEEELYAVEELLPTKTDYKAMIKAIALSHENYKGSGSPKFYTTAKHRINMLWIEDSTGRRIYETEATLAAALGVSAIVDVPRLENLTRVVDTKTRDLIGIKVNLKDYNVGADKGGQIANFDAFDIDFNQYKYLMETRVSGALTKPASAQIYEFERPAG